MKRANLGRQAKIVATLGPASSSVTMITALIEAGMNVAAATAFFSTTAPSPPGW